MFGVGALFGFVGFPSCLLVVFGVVAVFWLYWFSRFYVHYDKDDHDEDEDEDVLSPQGAAGARGFEGNASHADAGGLEAFRKQRSEVRLSTLSLSTSFWHAMSRIATKKI